MPLPAHTACSHLAHSAVALETMDNSNGLIRGRKRRERWKEEIGKKEEMKRKMSIRKGERMDSGEEKDDNRKVIVSGHCLLWQVLTWPYLSGHPTRLLCCPQSRWWCNLSQTTSRGHKHLQDGPYNKVISNAFLQSVNYVMFMSPGSPCFSVLQPEWGAASRATCPP